MASWLLTGSGAGALAAGLLAFSFSRSEVAESWLAAWVRGPMTGVLLLLVAAAAAAVLEKSRRAVVAGNDADPEPGAAEGESESSSAGSAESANADQGDAETSRWIDFPAFQLRALPLAEEDDGQVVEIAYDVPDKNLESFFEAMREMERIRLEEGAVWWTMTRDVQHPTVYHEFFLVGSWTEHQAAIAKEDGAARAFKLQAFAANDWETMPAEIHYPVIDAKRL